MSTRASTFLLLALGALVLALLAPIGPLGGEPSTATAQAGRPRAPSAQRSRSRRATRTRTSTRRRRFVPRLTAAQRRQIRRWHQRASRGEIEAWSRATPAPIVFRPIAGRERFELVPDDDGTFSGEALERAELAFTYRVDGTHRPIHPRLLQLVHRAVRHFHAPYVYVISGYRSGNPRSRHAQGRAIDLVLPGVPDRRLAGYLRPQGYVGVGIYPTSGFVHLDVRARSYFWSDASGPDQPNRERRILATLGPRFDRIARNLGAEPVPDLEELTDEESAQEENASPELSGTTLDVDEAPSEAGDEGTREGSTARTLEPDAGVPPASLTDASVSGGVDANPRE
ncbi:MAG: DUF882 domain-containing protein [Sandaracinaceae bacterium]|nr:DUF882 domain-containing protein [Sandaracinaceae bacterium]